MVAVNLSKNALEVFAGRKRARLLPTLVIAVLLTSVVAVPLVIRALDSTDSADAAVEPVAAVAAVGAADSQMIMVDTVNGDPTPLDTNTVAGPILISLRQPDATAVSFNLFAAGGDQAIVESLDLQGPQFDFIVDRGGSVLPFDSSLLSNGAYELFVTIRSGDQDRRTAVSFQVENP